MRGDPWVENSYATIANAASTAAETQLLQRQRMVAGGYFPDALAGNAGNCFVGACSPGRERPPTRWRCDLMCSRVE